MDVTRFWARGIAMSGLQQRRDDELVRATEKTRRQWMDSLSTDELRTWSDVGEKSAEPLRGLLVVLTLAGMCKTFDSGNPSHPSVRVIRGAISALDDCMQTRGCVINADDARALSAAADHARDAIKTASQKAIQHAAESLRNIASIN